MVRVAAPLATLVSCLTIALPQRIKNIHEFQECGERYIAPEEFGSKKVVQFCYGKDGTKCAIILASGDVKLMEPNTWVKCMPVVLEFGRNQGLADEKSKACRCIRDKSKKGPTFEFFRESMLEQTFITPEPFEGITTTTRKPTSTIPPGTTTPPMEFWAKPDPDSNGCLVKKRMTDETFSPMKMDEWHNPCPESVLNHGRLTVPGYEAWMTLCACKKLESGGVEFKYDGPPTKEFDVVPGKTPDGEPACVVKTKRGITVTMPMNKKMKCDEEIQENMGKKSPCCACSSLEPSGAGDNTYEWKFKFSKQC